VQPVVVEGQHFLVFSCAGLDLVPQAAPGSTGGVWAARGNGPLGPWDIAGAQQLTDNSRYVGKIVQRRDGSPAFLAFHDQGPQGFVGSITDPVDVRVEDGRLVLG
jgi:beta-fructofuranosidase